MKILANGLPATALYDSGANVSLINYNFYKTLNIQENVSGGNIIKTLTGISQAHGMTRINLKILDISDTHDLFIVKNESFKDDILLGLDSINKFKLCQDENLKISQKLETHKANTYNIMNEINNIKTSQKNKNIHMCNNTQIMKI